MTEHWTLSDFSVSLADWALTLDPDDSDDNDYWRWGPAVFAKFAGDIGEVSWSILP
jgi:hypothetical protein